MLALHHGYRVAGGEERAAEQLAALAETRLGERVAWLRRDSTTLPAARAARGLLAGGIDSGEVTAALQRSGADLLHAHNLFPTFGPSALRAARSAGAAVVVHLHNYRLVCAVATTVRDGHDCTECSAGRPLPGLRHRCRGSLPEAAVYAAALPRWQRAVIDLADVVIVPSAAAAARLRALGVELPTGRVHVVGGVSGAVATSSGAAEGRYALVVGRLAPEKDLTTAIDACRLAGLPLVIAGEGPERAALERHARRNEPAADTDADAAATLGPAVLAGLPGPPARHGTTTFLGRVDDATLAALRRGARVALAPSLAHETFGLSALESMAAAVPTIGADVGALPELLGQDCVAPPADAAAWARHLTRVAGSAAAGLAAAGRAERLAGAAVVGERLAAAYAAARQRVAAR